VGETISPLKIQHAFLNSLQDDFQQQLRTVMLLMAIKQDFQRTFKAALWVESAAEADCVNRGGGQPQRQHEVAHYAGAERRGAGPVRANDGMSWNCGNAGHIKFNCTRCGRADTAVG
jgi:hypothetical protein